MISPNASVIFHRFSSKDEWSMVANGMAAEFIMLVWDRLMASKNIRGADYHIRDLIADGWASNDMDAKIETLAREHIDNGKCAACWF